MRDRIETISWQQGKAELERIRRQVFIEEQSVPEELEWDEQDASALHFLVYTESSDAIATARLVQESPTQARIGRFAVLPQFRGQGLGTRLLYRILEVARNRGNRVLVLSAQLSAVPFYEKAEFVAYGGIYLDAGIEHRSMKLTISE